MKILYPVIDGEITGGNIICQYLIGEAIKRNHQVVVNSPTIGPFTQALANQGIAAYNVETRQPHRLDKATALAAIVRKEQVDLVHTHALLGGTILGSLAGKLAGVPVVVHAHIRFAMSSKPLVRMCHSLLLRLTSKYCCDRIIAVADGVAREVATQGLSSERAVVIHNGIQIPSGANQKEISQKIRQEFGLTDASKFIGIVGRLCESKGQHVLIQAANQVLRQFPDTVFVIVGKDLQSGGRYESHLKDLADKLVVRDRVIFTGFRPDARDLMAAFDLFVLPSSAEGLPVVILEAMAAGNCVITTPVGGNAEIVSNGETGIIIPPKDEQALADAIIRCLSDPDLTKEMGQRGYETVKNRFSLEAMVAKTFQVYDQVLEARNNSLTR